MHWNLPLLIARRGGPADLACRISLAKLCELFRMMGGRQFHLTLRVRGVLTEKEVSGSWHALFKGGGYNDETFAKAQDLLDELRAESPLRHRLQTELDELRKLQVADG